MDNVQALEAQLLALSIGADPINDLIEIDAENRTILLPTTELIFGVATDRSVERKYFVCPKIVGDNIDLSKFGIRINFENAADEKGVYIVDDVKVDGKYIRFSWLLSEQVLKRKGNVTFSVYAVQVEDEVVTVKWNTTTAIGTVLNGLEVEGLYDYEEEEVRDVLQQSLNALEATKDAKILELQNEGDLQTNLVGAKGALVLDSLPDDYTETNEMADTNSRFKAPVIKQVVEGELVTANDCSDMPMIGLSIFGKSTQAAEPTPDNPQEITSINNPTVSVYGKNLARCVATRTTDGNHGITITEELDTSEVILNGTATAQHSYGIVRSIDLPVGTYTISCIGVNKIDSTGDRLYLMNYDTNEVICNYVQDDKPKTFEITEARKYRVDMVFKEGTTYSNKSIKVQIERGDKATEYEPFIVGQSISSNYTLYGIPVSTGGNYTDSNGQQWICDEIDFERGKLIQNCFMETRTFSYDDTNSRYSTMITYEANINCAEGYGIPVMCDKLRFNPDTRNGLNGIRIATTSPKYLIGYYDDIVLSDVTVIYPLATPIETTLSDEELLAFKSMYTNYPSTTVMNNSNAGEKLTYAADTKLYIDNKFAELQAAITS